MVRLPGVVSYLGRPYCIEFAAHMLPLYGSFTPLPAKSRAAIQEAYLTSSVSGIAQKTTSPELIPQLMVYRPGFPGAAICNLMVTASPV
jgi:hypothetical protein